MEGYDPQMAARVWNRVRSRSSQLSPRQQALVRRCIQRTQANLRDYEALSAQGIYADAFGYLADAAREQLRMLRRLAGLTDPR